MFMRRITAIVLLLPILVVRSDRVSHADELQHFQDPVTGLTLAIPRSLVGREKRTPYGLNWEGKSLKLNIDTLAFPPERSLQSVYESLKKIPGRRLTRDENVGAGFILEGIDRDGARFIVWVTSNGATRGISVVYSSQQAEHTARGIAASFQANFLQTEVSILEPAVPTESYLRQAREILARVGRDPIQARKLWPEFGAATRKYRLRVGSGAATDAIRRLFAEHPASPLRSAAWGILPLGVIDGLARHNYSTLSIYGTKTEHPDIRQELVTFLADHPRDPFAFAAYYGIGEFDKAIAAAERSGMPAGMLYYAAAHKRLSSVLEHSIPNLEMLAADDLTKQHPKDCPTDVAPLRCYFYETFGVSDRLYLFTNRAAKTDPTKVRRAIEAKPAEIKQVIDHLKSAETLSRGLPHEDDANYYLGVIFRHLGHRSDAFTRFDAAFSSQLGEFHRDYWLAARRQIIQMLFEVPENERIAIVTNSKGFSDPAVWYVLGRDTYRRHDYMTTIRIAEAGLERMGIEIWRLPVATEATRIEQELRRLLRKSSDRYLDIHLLELVYLLNASRDMERFVRALQDRPSAIEPKNVRSIVLKYSLLTTSEKEMQQLHAGRLGQHRDLRQALYLTDLSLKTFPPSASPGRSGLTEWLLYRKVRILAQFDPKRVEEAVSALEQAHPRSTLLDDAYAELLYAQAFRLRAPDTTVTGTFQLIAARFPMGNALDNAYNWYAVYLRCKKDYHRARILNAEIIRRFPLTRHAIYAARRLASPEGCEMWYE